MVTTTGCAAGEVFESGLILVILLVDGCGDGVLGMQPSIWSVSDVCQQEQLCQRTSSHTSGPVKDAKLDG